MGKSKRFKDKTCVYCATPKISRTGDHVFARKFFLPSQRDNLPQVPACEVCNGKKSKLEHYLASVLPFGGRHDDALDNLANMVPGRLARNKRLRRELANGMSRIWVKEATGLYVRSVSIPFNGEALEELLKYIIKGLMWHHWKVLLDETCFVETYSLTAYGVQFFESHVGLRAKERVAVTIGNGTFGYRGALGIDNQQVSVWEFSVFGRLLLTENNSASDACVGIGGYTGPIRVKQNADQRVRKGQFIIRP